MVYENDRHLRSEGRVALLAFVYALDEHLPPIGSDRWRASRFPQIRQHVEHRAVGRDAFTIVPILTRVQFDPIDRLEARAIGKEDRWLVVGVVRPGVVRIHEPGHATAYDGRPFDVVAKIGSKTWVYDVGGAACVEHEECEVDEEMGRLCWRSRRGQRV